MPMSKVYSLGNRAILLWLVLTIIFLPGLSAQGLTCFGGLQASLDDACEVVIDASDILVSFPDPFVEGDFEITVTAQEGSSLDGVRAEISGGFLPLNFGSRIQFTEPGNFIVSVENVLTGVSCWGEFTVENKLPPVLIGDCMCPDTATVVIPECTFTCADISDFMSSDAISADLNPVFMDNCGEATNVMPTDVLTPDTVCGGYFITRTWSASMFSSHGVTSRVVGCRQRFRFTPIDSSMITAPNRQVTVECGTETDPASLRNFFSDSSRFPNAEPNDAILNSYPSVALSTDAPRFDTTIVTVQVTRDSTSMQTVEVADGIFIDGEVHHEITVDSSFLVITELPTIRLLGEDDEGVERFCQVFTQYSDTGLIFPDDSCPNTYKFVRTWKHVNWCTRDVWEETQIIKVADVEGPSFTTPNIDGPLSTGPWVCEADLIVPSPIDSTTSDNCSDINDITWLATVTLPDGSMLTASPTNGFTLAGLPLGTHAITYELTDECGNSSTGATSVTVVDGASPNVLAKNRIIVSISSFGEECSAKITPDNIDVGSFDACDDELLLEVRRVEGGTFGPYVRFTQDDITSIDAGGISFGEHMVELRVTDSSGNSSLGWTTVRIEDKTGSVEVECGPLTINLDCVQSFEEALMDSVNMPRAVFTSCAVSQLDIDFSIIRNDINSICNVGSAEVAYFISGEADTICIKQFNLGDIDVVSINFPPAEITVDCADEDFGEVVISGETCNNLVQTVDEEVFLINGGEGFCRKIVRTFTVIDWCVFTANSDSDAGVTTFEQTILVTDNTNPVIVCDSPTFSVGEDCGLSGITLSATGTDAGCSDELTWTARVDIDGDDIFDLVIDPTVIDSVASIMIDTMLTPGTYNVLWSAQDDCNNVTEELCQFTITDDVAPIASCVTSISTSLGDDGMVTIWAVDFDMNGSSTDACGGELTYSFSGEDRNVPSISLTCEDVPNGVTINRELTVWVWDESDNRSFCIVNYRVDDNADVCEDVLTGLSAISGTVTTSMGDDLQSANIFTTAASATLNSQTSTDVTGDYVFNSNPNNQDYVVTASKNDDFLNGVSTLDLVLIQQYILGMRSFDTPHQVIAADVNGDERVSSLDLVDIRRLILGTTSQFTSEQSWVFLDASQGFNSVDNPWPLYETINVDDLQSNETNNHFTAVKLGDVNGNAIANSVLAGTRNSQTAALEISNTTLKANGASEIVLTQTYDETIYGFQLSMDLKDLDITSIEVNGGALPNSHYVIDNDILKLSDVYPVGTHDIEITLHVIPHQDMMTSSAVQIDDSQIRSEIYVKESLESVQLTLKYNQVFDSVEGMQFELYQNEPNPFSNSTTIGFYIDQPSLVELSVFDMTGRQLYYDQQNYTSGQHSIFIDQSDLNSKGLLYYQLSAGDKVATKRMIIME